MKVERKIKIFPILFFVLCQIQSQAQCDGKNKGSRAEFMIELFLTLPDREPQRVETGAVNESLSSIAKVTSQSDCQNIQDIIDKDDLLKEIDSRVNQGILSPIGRRQVKYFYQSNNYFYLFWDDHPDYDDRPKTGPKTMFVIIKKDFSEYWKYYF